LAAARNTNSSGKKVQKDGPSPLRQGKKKEGGILGKRPRFNLRIRTRKEGKGKERKVTFTCLKGRGFDSAGRGRIASNPHQRRMAVSIYRKKEKKKKGSGCEGGRKRLLIFPCLNLLPWGKEEAIYLKKEGGGKRRGQPAGGEGKGGLRRASIFFLSVVGEEGRGGGGKCGGSETEEVDAARRARSSRL